MKVLHITNAFPYKENHVLGIFIKEQIESLADYLERNDVYFINAQKNGKIEYLKSIFKLRKIIAEYDIIHAHHIFSGMIVLFFLGELDIRLLFH